MQKTPYLVLYALCLDMTIKQVNSHPILAITVKRDTNVEVSLLIFIKYSNILK